MVLTDPVKVEPEHYTVLFENDRVRLLQFKDKPGDKIAMHGHPDYVAYTMKALKRRLIAPDGSYRDVQAEAGTAVWSEAVTHAEVNIGDTETHLLLFEVK
ncbi:MAG: cytoplasmic protein [Acidobacteria bacterium]|nr:cytoplasmic protein [Acidobacteriota bacterium]